MQETILENMMQKYQKMIDDIDDDIIKNLYSEFLFLFYHCPTLKINNVEIDSEFFLFNSKFITYHTTNIILNYNETKVLNNNDNNCTDLKTIVICTEGRCIIIEQIDNLSINKLIEYIKKKNISILNFNLESSNPKTKEEFESKEEVKNFCQNFFIKIQKNQFIKQTIYSIVGYSIRRFFYPSEYFLDCTFFNFKRPNKTQEQENKYKLRNFLFIKEHDIKKLYRDRIVDVVYEQDLFNEDKSINNNFKEEEFITLRTLSGTENATFSLVIHRETLFIFMMKKLYYNKDFHHEFEFNEKCSHRCLTKFYGFLRDENRIIGFIYEFMSNGSLQNLYKNKERKINNLFLLTSINRIFKGIDYIHSKHFIHRDLKPDNILLNHDNIPFVSDFDLSRYLSNDTELSNEKEMTNDIGSTNYSSPEQISGKEVSYPTDIYSFGLIINFLISITPPDFTIPPNITKLFKKCTEKEILKRPKEKDIRKLLNTECNKLDHIFSENINKLNNSDLVNFIYENIITQEHDNERLYLLIHEVEPFFTNLNFTKLILNSLFSVLPSTEYTDNDDYIKYYDISTIVNDSYTFDVLAEIYDEGIGVEKNYHKSMKYYEMSAKLNNSNALYHLGIFYEVGKGVKQDYQKAKEYYELSAKHDVNGLMMLARMYFLGIGVKKDLYITFLYIEFAARQSHPIANYILGCFYENGIIVNQNYKKAKEYYEIAAALNCSDGLIALGELYYNGYGVNKDYLKAFDYFDLVADQNEPDGYLNLGKLYYHGYGVSKNKIQAEEYYELASEFYCKKDLKKLGFLYENGIDVKKDYRKAFQYYYISSQANDEEAQLKVGDFYFQGYSVPKDIFKAKEIYEKLSEKNNSEALFRLGKLYYHGYGVEKDYSKAKKYYELSSKLNNSKAFYKIGKLYEKGNGVTQNYKKASRYYEISSQFNYSKSYLNIGKLYEKGQGFEQNYSQAIKYYKYSSQLNNREADFYVGNYYSNGYIFPKELKKAIEYYTKCAEKKNVDYEFFNSENFSFRKETKYNKYQYISSNNLGLIYIIEYQNFKEGIKYLKKSCFNEYQIGQNNYGLFLQMYQTNEIENAKYYYNKAAKKHFSLSYYNLAYLYENDNNYEESIICYIQASEKEDIPIIFNNIQIHDIQLEISKTFIICLTNLILTHHFLFQKDLVLSKKYFIKAFNKIKINENNIKYEFQFVYNHQNIKHPFSYIKDFILQFPSFNLKNQPNLQNEMKTYFQNQLKIETETQLKQSEDEYKNKNCIINSISKVSKDKINYKGKENNKKHQNKHLQQYTNKITNKEQKIIESITKDEFETNLNLNIYNNIINMNKKAKELIFYSPEDLFDFIIKDQKLIELFQEGITDIISTIKKILYTPPYYILFGRINLDPIYPNQNINTTSKDLDEEFYSGLGLQEFKYKK